MTISLSSGKPDLLKNTCAAIWSMTLRPRSLSAPSRPPPVCTGPRAPFQPRPICCRSPLPPLSSSSYHQIGTPICANLRPAPAKGDGLHVQSVPTCPPQADLWPPIRPDRTLGPLSMNVVRSNKTAAGPTFPYSRLSWNRETSPQTISAPIRRPAIDQTPDTKKTLIDRRFGLIDRDYFPAPGDLKVAATRRLPPRRPCGRPRRGRRRG